MKRCENMVSQTVPTRYSAKIVEVRCGSTGIYGDPIYCAECRARHEAAGHLPYECPHGVDMRPEGAVCSRCEFGDEIDSDCFDDFIDDDGSYKRGRGES